MSHISAVLFHSTGHRRAKAILERGFRIPETVAQARTDGQVGDFYPAIFFSRIPSKNYGPAIVEARVSGEFIAWRPKKRESASETLHRLIVRSNDAGYCGVDSRTDWIGIAVTCLGCLREVRVPHLSSSWFQLDDG